MQIFFKTFCYGTITIDVDSSDSVLSVKKKIAAKQGFIILDGFKIILEGKELFDNENFLAHKPQEYATVHLIIPSSTMVSQDNEIPRYLMLDHGGVLDGEVCEVVPKSNDLLLQTYDWGGYQVLKNGVQIVRNLKELVDKHGYKIVFHSKNKEEDQINLLEQLQAACFTKAIEFPQVIAMAVCDVNRFENVDSTNPKITINQKNQIKITGYAKELDGKACVRNALSNLLSIPEDINARKKHIVFDDGASIVTMAKGEGYKAYLIGHGEEKISLDDAVKEVLNNARKNVLVERISNSPLVQQNAMFANPYKNLPEEFRQYLSATTQSERHQLGHISTEDYWTQSSSDQQEQLFKQFKKSRATDNNNTINAVKAYRSLSKKKQQFISEKTQDDRVKFGNISAQEYWDQLSFDKQEELLAQYTQRSCSIS